MTEIAFFIVSEQIKFGGWKKKKKERKGVSRFPTCVLQNNFHNHNSTPDGMYNFKKA